MQIETERLILRDFKDTDVERMFLMDSNPEVMRYIRVPPVKNIEESKEIIKFIQKQYKDNGIGRFAVIEKESNLFIGWSGLKFLTEEVNGYQNIYELGYRFLQEAWGKGYASEAALSSLDFGFNTLNIEIIYACAHSENEASNHILNKLGFNKTSEFTYPSGIICFWYELKREQYNLRQ